MAIFGSFRRLLATLENLVEQLKALVWALLEIVRLQEELGPASTRLEALELSRAQFEAEIHGKFLKAEGKLRGAANAEARERQLKKSYERLANPLDEDGAEAEAPLRNAVVDDDVEAREAERLQTLRLDVAPGDKTYAVRAKFLGQ